MLEKCLNTDDVSLILNEDQLRLIRSCLGETFAYMSDFEKATCFSENQVTILLDQLKCIFEEHNIGYL